jgi:uncharacterized protein
VAKDDKEAVRWSQKAVDKGNALAMISLGCMYANGRGVEKVDNQSFGGFAWPPTPVTPLA